MEYNRKMQVYSSGCTGKTVESMDNLSQTQIVINFTDGTHLVLTARTAEGLPFIATRVEAGAIEKEWK